MITAPKRQAGSSSLPDWRYGGKSPDPRRWSGQWRHLPLMAPLTGVSRPSPGPPSEVAAAQPTGRPVADTAPAASVRKPSITTTTNLKIAAASRPPTGVVIAACRARWCLSHLVHTGCGASARNWWGAGVHAPGTHWVWRRARGTRAARVSSGSASPALFGDTRDVSGADVCRLRALAKLALTLRVTGVHRDGYHLLDSEMVTSDLADELEFPDGDGLECSFSMQAFSEPAFSVPVRCPPARLRGGAVPGPGGPRRRGGPGPSAAPSAGPARCWRPPSTRPPT